MPNRHALIIDDQNSNIEVLAMLLSQQGVSHASVTSGREVPDAIGQQARIDVVFLDLEMPNGDFYKLLTDLKADPRLQGVPIVAYTVHTSEMDTARKAGFDGFLGKPLNATDFPANLERILSGEQVWTY